MADIKAASDTFDTGAKDFRNAIPDNLAGHTVDSGESALNSTITAVLAGIDGLHTQVAGALSKASGQLMNAHNDYQRTDGDSARHLYDAMLKAGPAG